MREFIIQEDDANQRVDKFIQKTIPKLPKGLMYKSIRNKKIKVNRKRCEISQRLEVGDQVLCFLAEEFFEQPISYDFLEVPATLDVIYEDEHLVLIRKPQGLLTHKDQAGVQDNLADRFLHYLYEKKEYDPASAQSFTPALCHRLDRNTEGIMIAAKTAEALRRINEHIRNHEIEKRYVCIVEGRLKRKHEDLLLWHAKDEQKNKVTLFDQEQEGTQMISTSYTLLRQERDYALVEVLLHTGKSHQIRAVMSYLHHPLYGDVKYGAKKNNRNDYQALCAYKLTFAFEDAYFSNLPKKEWVLKQNSVETLFLQLTQK